MVHKFIDNLFDMEISISRVVKNGLIFSMLVCLAAVTMFYFQNKLSLGCTYHDAALTIFRAGITFGISFFICGIATNAIKKDIIS